MIYLNQTGVKMLDDFTDDLVDQLAVDPWVFEDPDDHDCKGEDGCEICIARDPLDVN